MRRVLFSGYYGQGNAGDDVFCFVASQLRDKVEVNYTPWFIASTLPPVAPEAVPIYQRLPSWMPPRISIASSALACHNVVLFGGSTLHRLNSTRMVLMRLAQSRLIRLSAVGISVGPFADAIDAAAVGNFLRSCKEVLVRDERSVSAAGELGVSVTLGLDPAVLLDTLVGRGGRVERTLLRPVLGVSISAAGLDEDEPSHLSPRFIRLASLIREAHDRTGAEIRLINMQSHARAGDGKATAWLYEQLQESCPVSVHNHDGEVARTLGVIQNCTAVIGVRLHSCILAYGAGVPFIMIDYQPKCRDFLDTIGAQHSRADSTLENLEEVRKVLELALSGRPLRPSVTPGDAVRRCLTAFGKTRVWRGIEQAEFTS